MNESILFSPLEARRDEIFKRIENKVEIIKNLRTFAQRGGLLSAEELEKECALHFESIKERFPEKLDLFAEYKRNSEKLAAVYDDNDERPEEVILSDQDIWRLESLNEEIEADADVYFLIKVEKFLKNLLKKRIEVIRLRELYSEDREAFFLQVGKTIATKNLDEIEKAELIWDGYNLVLLCDPVSVSILFSSRPASGCHYHGTVVSVVAKKDNWGSYITHEKNHNFEEMFGGNTSFYADKFLASMKRAVGQLQNLKKVRAPKFLIDGSERSIKGSISNYCYQNFHEVVADLDDIEERKINTILANFYKALDLIEKFADKIDDSEMKEWVMASIIKLEENFAEILKNIGELFFAAKELGSIDEAKAALVLFQMENLDRVKKYLSWRLGPRFDFLCSLRPVLQDGHYFSESMMRRNSNKNHARLDFLFGRDEAINQMHRFDIILAEKTGPDSLIDLDNIRQLASALERDNSLGLSDSEKKEFYYLLESDSLAAAYENLEIDNFLELARKLLFISERLAVPNLRSLVLEKFTYLYFDNCLSRAVKNNDFSLPEEFFNKWPYEKEVLLGFLREERGYYIDQYKKANKSKGSGFTLSGTNLGKFFEKLGLSEQANKE